MLPVFFSKRGCNRCLSSSFILEKCFFLSFPLFVCFFLSIFLSFLLSVFLSFFLSFFPSLCVSLFLSSFLCFFLSFFLSFFLPSFLSTIFNCLQLPDCLYLNNSSTIILSMYFNFDKLLFQKWQQQKNGGFSYLGSLGSATTYRICFSSAQGANASTATATHVYILSCKPLPRCQ
jgi:hypothetical protein